MTLSAKELNTPSFFGQKLLKVAMQSLLYGINVEKWGMHARKIRGGCNVT
jgi:hypothetical protein